MPQILPQMHTQLVIDVKCSSVRLLTIFNLDPQRDEHLLVQIMTPPSSFSHNVPTCGDKSTVWKLFSLRIDRRNQLSLIGSDAMAPEWPHIRGPALTQALCLMFGPVLPGLVVPLTWIRTTVCEFLISIVLFSAKHIQIKKPKSV